MEQKTFKSYPAALAYADGSPIIHIGKFYIVGLNGLDSIDFIASPGEGQPYRSVSGTVTVRHLSRGNHNHCHSGTAFLGDTAI